MAGIPLLGLFGWAAHRAVRANHPGARYAAWEKKWGLDPEIDRGTPVPSSGGKKLNIGIIGFGWQGTQLAKGLGFVHPSWIEQCRSDPQNKPYMDDFLSQFDLNVRIGAVCDVHADRARQGMEVSMNDTRPGGGKGELEPAKIYPHYMELLADRDIDAVIIATPDFWHATMVKEAVKAGKHIYCEKPMTIRVDDANEVSRVIRESGLVFQLGHQNHQQVSHLRAGELFRKGAVGDLNLVEFTANRYRVGSERTFDREALARKIDWDAFQEILPAKRDFDPRRFFDWYHFFDYGNGVAGSMLTHEYSSADQILQMGIPDSVISTGGRYVSLFNGEIPDVFTSAMEYRRKKFTFLYSLTYGNDMPRGRYIMGSEGTMQVGSNVEVYPRKDSALYPDSDPEVPVYEYNPAADVDAASSATQKYFAKKGLMYTYRYGRRLDTIHLHVKEWIDCIRNGGTPTCHIGLGYNEAITCCMAHRSYLEGRAVGWDPEHRKITV